MSKTAQWALPIAIAVVAGALYANMDRGIGKEPLPGCGLIGSMADEAARKAGRTDCLTLK
jgi:hypothetical protein